MDDNIRNLTRSFVPGGLCDPALSPFFWTPERRGETSAWWGHVPFAQWLVCAIRPRLLVELGTHYGVSYAAFCSAVQREALPTTCFAVDTWQGDPQAGLFDESVYQQVCEFHDARYNGFSTLLRCTFDDAVECFQDGSIDLLHIDGYHTYEAVRHDFETWLPKLSDRAVVLFHDIAEHRDDFGVWRLWQEIKLQYPHFEFRHAHGLGVLAVGASPPAAMQQLCAMDDSEAVPFRNRLALIGERWTAEMREAHFRQEIERQPAELENRVQEALRLQHAQQRQSADQEIERLRAAHRDEVELLRQATKQEILWRDNMIRSKDQLIAAKEELLQLRHNEIQERDAVIDQRDLIIRERDDRIHALGLQINERDTELQRHYRAHEDLRQDRDRLAREYENERVQVIRGYEDAIARLNELHRDEMARVRNGYLNSTSWRITAPVRGLRVVAQKLRGREPLAAGAAAPLGDGATAPRLPAPDSSGADATTVWPAPASAAPAVLPGAADLKSAFRRLLATRLHALLAGPGKVELPCSARPDVTVVLVLYNQAELTLWCLESIAQTLRNSALGVQVVIVDNDSTDATADLLQRVSGAEVVRNRYNMHFLRAVNAAAPRARGRHLLLLNNDAQLLPGSVEAAVRTLDGDAGIGAIGGRILLLDGTLQEAGSIIWNDGACRGYGRGGDPRDPEFMFRRDVDYCSGAMLLTPRHVFERLGGFDERYAPCYYEETDYCVRLWKSGLRVVYDPDVAIVHFEFGSSGSSEQALAQQQRNWTAFREAHADWLRGKYPHSPAHLLAARVARPDAKRVLVIEDRVPKVELGSGYPRSNAIIGELVAAGAAVTLFPTFRHDETWPEIRKALGPSVEVMIDAEGGQLRPFLAARRGYYDAILVCRPHNMRMFEEAISADRSLIGRAMILYDAEAIFARRSILARAVAGKAIDADEERRMIAGEVSLTRLADAVISVSPSEQQLLANHGVRNIHLLAHALTEMPIDTPFEQRSDIVFVGAIQDDNAPNADAVRWFVQDVLPQLQSRLGEAVHLKFIGLNKAPSIARFDPSAVEFVGQVDDLGPALANARLMVVPTRFAAGVPHKVHQAAALGIPMVVTSLIAEQVGWTSGEDYLVGPDAVGFAECCAELYRDRAVWEKIRRNALDRCRAECSPAGFRKRLREILDGVPVVHRSPADAVRDAASAETARSPATGAASAPRHVGRPIETDYSLAVPFAYCPEATAAAPRPAVIAHMFHADIAPELRYYLRNLEAADLFVSTDTEEKRSVLAGVLGSWDKGEVEFRVLPNCGRDIAPKLIGFRDVYERYDYVLHLHSKKSHHAGFLAPWRSFLYENLVGSPFVVASVFEAFARLPDLGIVFPQHFEPVRRWLDWTDNFEIARDLAARAGIRLDRERALDFPSGSMFWARSAALRPLLDLGLTFDDFPPETGQLDQTPAHAIERLFLYACERAGYRWLKIARPELYIDTGTIVPVHGPEDLATFVAAHGVVLSGPNPPEPRPEPAPIMTIVPPGMVRVLQARRL